MAITKKRQGRFLIAFMIGCFFSLEINAQQNINKPHPFVVVKTTDARIYRVDCSKPGAGNFTNFLSKLFYRSVPYRASIDILPDRFAGYTPKDGYDFDVDDIWLCLPRMGVLEENEREFIYSKDVDIFYDDLMFPADLAHIYECQKDSLKGTLSFIVIDKSLIAIVIWQDSLSQFKGGNAYMCKYENLKVKAIKSANINGRLRFSPTITRQDLQPYFKDIQPLNLIFSKYRNHIPGYSEHPKIIDDKRTLCFFQNEVFRVVQGVGNSDNYDYSETIDVLDEPQFEGSYGAFHKKILSFQLPPEFVDKSERLKSDKKVPKRVLGIEFTVTEEGSVSDVIVNQSVHPVLDSAFVDFFSSKFKFLPKILNNVKIRDSRLLYVPFYIDLAPGLDKSFKKQLAKPEPTPTKYHRTRLKTFNNSSF